MTERDPASDVPPLPALLPREPAPAFERSAGCGTPLLVGCAVSLLLVSTAAVVFLYRASDLVEWAFRQSRDAVMAALPEEVTDGERYRLERAYAEVVAAVLANRVAPVELGELQSAIGEAQRRAQRGELERADVQELIAVLERVAGRGGGGEGGGGPGDDG